MGTTPEAVVASRAIQGASTTFVWVTGLSFLVSRVGEEDLGSYVGWTTVGVAVGEVMGPLIGGPIYEHFGHWATFGIVEALLFLDVFFRLFSREKPAAAVPATLVRTAEEEEPLLENTGAAVAGYNATTAGRSQPGEAVSPAQMKALMAQLGWNWLGSVVLLVVTFLVRGAMEVVSLGRCLTGIPFADHCSPFLCTSSKSMAGARPTSHW